MEKAALRACSFQSVFHTCFETLQTNLKLLPIIFCFQTRKPIAAHPSVKTYIGGERCLDPVTSPETTVKDTIITTVMQQSSSVTPAASLVGTVTATVITTHLQQSVGETSAASLVGTVTATVITTHLQQSVGETSAASLVGTVTATVITTHLQQSVGETSAATTSPEKIVTDTSITTEIQQSTPGSYNSSSLGIKVVVPVLSASILTYVLAKSLMQHEIVCMKGTAASPATQLSCEISADIELGSLPDTTI
ncbi:uncharacterized protein LOC144480912 [Mustelus asterias]